jgi:hypothetical protein
MTQLENNEDSLDFIVQGLVSKEPVIYPVIYVVEEKPLSRALDQCLNDLESKEPITTFFIIEEEIFFDGLP